HPGHSPRAVTAHVLIAVATGAGYFFFTDTAPTEIYTLSLHDALPISVRRGMVDCGHGDAHDLDPGPDKPARVDARHHGIPPPPRRSGHGVRRVRRGPCPRRPRRRRLLTPARP